MSNKTVEILLKASDQFSDTTEKANLKFAALKINADNVNKAFEKLSAQHPDLSATEAKAAAEAMNRLKTGTEHATESLAKSKESAHAFGEVLGIKLPGFVRGFIAESEHIGPALNAAFSTVAVVGLIQVLIEIPEIFDKMIEKVTGWDETSKKAYASFIDSNNAARMAVLDMAAATDKAWGKDAEDSIKRVSQEITEQEKLLRELRQEMEGTTMLTEQGPVTVKSSRSDQEIAESIAKAEEYRNELIKKRNELNKESAVEQITNERETAAWFGRSQAAAVEFHQKQIELHQKEFDTAKRAAEIWNDNAELMRATTEEIVNSVGATERALAEHQKKANDAIQDILDKSHARLLDAIGEENQARSAAITYQTGVYEKGAKEQSEILDQQLKSIDEGAKANAEFLRKQIDDVKNSAGKIFDDMFIKGEGVFSSLGNMLKGGALSLGRSIFEDIVGALGGPIKAAFEEFFKGLISGPINDLGKAVSGIFGGGGGVSGIVGTDWIGSGKMSGSNWSSGFFQGLGSLGVIGDVGVIGGAFGIGTLIGNAIGNLFKSAEDKIREELTKWQDAQTAALQWSHNQFGYTGLIASTSENGIYANTVSGSVPHYAEGTPYVPNDGLAYLHRGEAVIPAAQNQSVTNTTNAPVYNITVNGVGDLNETARKIGQALYRLTKDENLVIVGAR